MNRRQFVTSGALTAAVSAPNQNTIASAKPMRALMKLGATVRGGGSARGERGESPARPQVGEGVNRRGAGQPRDLEQGFRSLGRWGVKNVFAPLRLQMGASMPPSRS